MAMVAETAVAVRAAAMVVVRAVVRAAAAMVEAKGVAAKVVAVRVVDVVEAPERAQGATAEVAAWAVAVRGEGCKPRLMGWQIGLRSRVGRQSEHASRPMHSSQMPSRSRPRPCEWM